MSMLQAYKTKNKTGFTMPEIIIGLSIIAVLFGLFARWFFINRKYQQTVGRLAEANQNIRHLSYSLTKELRVARALLYPTACKNANDKVVAASDDKLVFKAFNGSVVAYYLSKKEGDKSKTLYKCVVPGDKTDGFRASAITTQPAAKNIDKILFTANEDSGRYVSIYIESMGVCSLEGVFLLNE